MDLKLAGIYYSGIIVNSCLILFSLWRIRKRKLINWVLDTKILGDALKYSVPLIPHSLSGSISQYLAKLFLGNSFSLATVGIFSLASQFGRIIDTVQGSVHSSYLPWFFEVRSNRASDAPKAVNSLLPVLLDLYGIFFLAFSLFSQELVIIMADSSYASAWILIPLFVCVYAIKTPYYFYSAFLFYDKAKTRFIFIATLTGNSANVCAASLLIPHFGTYGSLAADFLSTVILLAIIIFMCRKEHGAYFRFSLFLKNNLKLFAFMAAGLLPGLFLIGSKLHIGNTAYKIVVWGVFTSIFLIKHKTTVTATVNKFLHRKEAVK